MTILSPIQVLQAIPQQKPFRFVDEIIDVSDDHILGEYTFKKDEFFYSGHFPDKPVTPGVILLECMAQIGVVAFGIYLLSKEVGREETNNWLTLFSDASVEFSEPVYPGVKVLVEAKKKFWRRMKLCSEIKMVDQSGKLLATSIASGVGVRK